MKYFISPDKEPKEKLIEAKLIQIISKYFPNATIEKIEDEKRAYSHQAIFEKDEKFTDILIPKSLDSLVINTNMLDDLIDFINAIRNQFLENENILLYDESYSYVVPIPNEGIMSDML